MQVQKYGRTTGFTTGSINAVNVDVDVCYFPLTETICFPGYQAHFVNQFSIPDGSVPFSAAGDSGSLLVTTGSNNPVGLLFAGGDGLTIANPIDAVLQRFSVTIDGAPAGPTGRPAPLPASRAIAGDGQVDALLDGAELRRRLADLGLQGRIAARARTRRPASPTLGVHDELRGLGRCERHDLLLQGVRARTPTARARHSNEASATPIRPSRRRAAADRRRLQPPNENPLSDAGRWTNGIIGSVETGLNTTSNTLACSKTTTCTAWRNAAQYGPDVEVWARLSTLPGDEQPASPARPRPDSRARRPTTATCCVRTSSREPTRSCIERVDNGAIVNLLDVNQELAAGDIFLLRVKGSTVEAWRNDGSAWSRLGTTTDSTYAGVGFVGVGMRGTTGRARRLRSAQPEPEPTGSPYGPLGSRWRRIGDALLDGAELRRRLAGFGLQGLSRHEPEPDDCSRHARRADDVRGLGAPERRDLLLQGVRAQRQRREPALGQVLCDPIWPRRTGRAAADRRRLQPHGEPALRRRALDERDQRLGRDRPEHDLEHARMLEDDDLHRLA